MIAKTERADNGGRRGRFICIEGIDASGKSTLLSALTRALQARGIDAVSIMKKQTDGYADPFVARMVCHLKAMLWDATPEDPVHVVAESNWVLMHTLWYELAQEHLIDPLLRQHDVVVSDGWFYKFLARHRVHCPHDARTPIVLANVREADLVLFLDVTPAECLARRPEFRPSELGAHGQVEAATPNEKFIEYQSQVYAQYRQMAEHPSWRLIRSIDNDPPDVIAARMADHVVGSAHDPHRT